MMKRPKRPTFFSGAMQTLDFYGMLTTKPKSFKLSGFADDTRALRGDWQRIGLDIDRALNLHRKP